MNKVQIEVSEIVIDAWSWIKQDGTVRKVSTECKRLSELIDVVCRHLMQSEDAHALVSCEAAVTDEPHSWLVVRQRSGCFRVMWVHDDVNPEAWVDDTDLSDETHFSWTVKLDHSSIDITQDE